MDADPIEVSSREVHVLRDLETGSDAVISSARGGMVLALRLRGVPILAWDENALVDPTANVRGGIPILFPAPGRLAEGRYVKGGRVFQMKQHGFARDLPWDIVAAGADEARARLSLALSSSPLTRALFPFDFRLVFTYELRDAMLTIDQRILDTGAEGSESMPLHLGFHPYFRVPDSRKSATTITTAATRAFDNVAGVEIPFSGFDLTRRELDLHLVDHGSTGATLRVPGSGSVQISASPEFTHWVVWTQAGRDFVCVEPWSAPGNALNTGKRLLHLAPGEERRLWMKISHTPE